ncbi:B2 bradykinin receptor-like [Rhinophrynus dorsalis]
MWIIFVLGFLENSFVLMILLLHKSRCTVAEIYLGNLAFADLLFVCGLPFWAIYVSNQFYWPFGSFLCVFVSALIQFNLYGSIYFLMMISFDRYLALVKTMSFGRMRRVGCAKFNCVIIWVFAVMVSMPKSIFRTVEYHPDFNTTACLIMPPSYHWHIATNILLNVIGFLIPVSVISYCSFHIIKVLRNNSMQNFKEIKNEKKATILVFAVLLAFIICWLPFHVFTFIDTLHLSGLISGCAMDQFQEIGNQISTYIGFSNSCINPLLYVIVGNHFRKKTVGVFKQFTSKQQRSRNASIPTDFSADTLRTSISMEPKKSRIF